MRNDKFNVLLDFVFATFVGAFSSTERRKIRLKEGNARCRLLKELTCKGTLRQVFIFLGRVVT
jgi:hypothetical protein